MPLLLLDLDNTLVDRDAAFRAAVADFLVEHALPVHDAEWLMTVDAGGYTPRAEVARAVRARYGARAPGPAVRDLLDRGAADRVVLSGPVRIALARALTSGWTLVIVTNGRAAQQETKIRATGLDALTHGWVVSESVGHKKPAPQIFHAAAATVGVGLDGAWVIGDSPHADIAGAVGIGARSVWVSAGRPWTETAHTPTRTAPDTASAIDSVVDAPG
ncbi:hydrolase [Streptomyces sp. A244]|uniref:HAD family hydrolase n=1 Tax=Streptomyces sp. A244 TaxID=2137016 RepID=UPI000D1B4CE5|nr:HAD family hydrolase [Streptomyces sp. A244]PTH84226.1 hydrolase [Streptomyces sp. A244]